MHLPTFQNNFHFLVWGKFNSLDEMEQIQRPKQKSVIIAYILWLFGGIFGLHHLYLHRDRQAFIWWSTLGGYFGIGWLSEIFTIPRMVRDANEDPKFIEWFVHKLRKHRKPKFSTNRFIGAFMIGYFWGTLIQMATPEQPFMDIDFGFLHWLIPLFVALGVWTVGNIGREKGVLWHCLLAAYITYPIRYFVFDEIYWFSGTVFVSCLAFDVFSKEWRREPPKRYGRLRRTVYLSAAVTIYLSLWGCYFFFNGTISDGEGGEVPVHEAVRNFLASPWWTDVKQTLYETYQYAQYHGWYETWKLIFDTMDVDGENNAYKVLGLSPTASQTEITAAWRKLSKENHPDKVKDSSKRDEAQEKFMEIQQAYEILSKIKSRRKRKNKKFNEDL